MKITTAVHNADWMKHLFAPDQSVKTMSEHTVRSAYFIDGESGSGAPAALS